MNLKSKLAKVAIALLIVLAGLMGSAPPAHALSGSGYNNTDPYATGCGQGAYVVSSKYIAPYGTGSMVYSPRCGTNWVEWYAPGTNYYVWKWMGAPVVTTLEQDWGSWSYGRQVYAPGNTVASGNITIAGSTYSWWQQWRVTCGSSCTWTRID